MRHEEREIFHAKVAEILHQAFVQIRAYTGSPIPGENESKQQELHDLADLLHNMPRYIVGHDEHAIDSVEQFRATVIDHVKRFYPNSDPELHRYVFILDMEPDLFTARYKHHRWDMASASQTS